MANISYAPSIAARNNTTGQLRRRVNQNVSALDTAQTNIQTAQTDITSIQTQLASGANGTVTLAKITGGGANGSLTVVNGKITVIVQPT